MLRAEMESQDQGRRAPEGDDRVPLFGTWPRIYGAVVATAVVVMVLLTLFSGWAW
jgi:hypothetical protein